MRNKEVVGAGVDWLTITAVDDDTSINLGTIKDRILQDEQFKGVIPEKWGSMGYRGQNWGPMKLGVRNQHEAILILSGNICSSALCWTEIDPDRVKRVDLQVTVGLKMPSPNYALTLYQLLPTLTEFSRYVKMMKYISSFTGDTLYIGKRGRSHLLRIYDKSMDCGYRKTGYAWRFEMEYRNDAAKQVVRRLNEKNDKQGYILGQVTAELSKRSIKSSFGATSVIDAIEVSASVATAETKLDWLSRCVSPVVMKLLSLGYEEEIIDMLKLKNIINRRTNSGSR